MNKSSRIIALCTLSLATLASINTAEAAKMPTPPLPKQQKTSLRRRPVPQLDSSSSSSGDLPIIRSGDSFWASSESSQPAHNPVSWRASTPSQHTTTQTQQKQRKSFSFNPEAKEWRGEAPEWRPTTAGRYIPVGEDGFVLSPALRERPSNAPIKYISFESHHGPAESQRLNAAAHHAPQQSRTSDLSRFFNQVDSANHWLTSTKVGFSEERKAAIRQNLKNTLPSGYTLSTGTDGGVNIARTTSASQARSPHPELAEKNFPSLPAPPSQEISLPTPPQATPSTYDIDFPPLPGKK